ncbi:MAG: flagellar basal body rod protein FlgB, partial [Clostridia bacterium]|nr:flagellar basal body rod protein FlgB [Clostridia bacterium]
QVLRTNILKFFVSGVPFKQIDKGRKEKKALVTGQKKMQLKTTHHKHIDIASHINDIQPQVVKDTSTSMRLDGNNVDIDMENANLAANQLLYNALVQQASTKISTLRYVISEGKR